MRFLYWIIAFLLLSEQSLFAFIYDIKVARLKDQAGLYRYVIGCSDYHNKLHPSNDTQRNFLLRTLSMADPNRCFLMLEDLSSPNATHPCSCKQFVLKAKFGILAQLVSDVRMIGIQAVNVEYRYCRVIGLGGILSSLNKSPYESAAACEILMSTILDEVNCMLAHVEAYNDMEALNAWYKQHCKRVKRAMVELNLEKLRIMSCAAYFEQETLEKDRQEFINKLFIFDTGLIDCSIIHELVNSKKPVSIIIAGGTHIDNVFKQLKAMEYEVVMPGFNTKAKGSREPKPISLEVLERYIK